MAANSLARNTGMLYILLVSNYVFGFVSIPFLTRVLGPETYGKIGLAVAVTTYFQLLLDFGFILSATAKVSEQRDDSRRISQLLGAVTEAKLVLASACVVVLGVLFAVSEELRGEWALYCLYLLYAIVNSLIPDFLYRGIEQMQIVTLRTVTIKVIALILMILFIREPGQYVLVPLFCLMGSLASLLAVVAHLYRKTAYRFVFVQMGAAIREVKDSASFFLSRIAGTVYGSLSVIILGALYPGSPQVGFYSAADRAISAGKSFSSPIADSLYPYMIKRKNYRLLVLTAGGGALLLAGISALCAIYATEICVFLFGAEYEATAPILQLLLPLIPISLLTYLFGFPALVPLGLAKWANASVIMGACFQAVALVALAATSLLDVGSLCIVMVMAELVVLSIRLVAFVSGYRKR